MNIENTKEDSKKKPVKDIKFFLKKKKTKRQKRAWERYQNFTEEEKQKRLIRNVRRSNLTIEEIIINI